MVSFKSHTYLYILYTLTALSGCRCKDNWDDVPSPTPPHDAFEYWPVDSANTQWIYAVSRVDSSGNKIYQYDDTMQFLGDTSLTIRDDIYFREFAFKKLPKEENLIMGTLYNPGLLYLYLNGIFYTMYDLNNISDKPPFKTYRTDGKPIDIRYEMNYYSPFDLYNTKLGIVKSIRTFYQFRDWSMAGSITKSVTIISGQKKGPVYLEYLYQRTKFQFLKDSTANVIYEIKKINHQ